MSETAEGSADAYFTVKISGTGKIGSNFNNGKGSDFGTIAKQSVIFNHVSSAKTMAILAKVSAAAKIAK